MTLQSLLQSGLKASDEMALACENRTYSFRQFDHITDVIAFNLTDRFGRNNEAVMYQVTIRDKNGKISTEVLAGFSKSDVNSSL